jgi:hypothetical protein
MKETNEIFRCNKCGKVITENALSLCRECIEIKDIKVLIAEERNDVDGIFYVVWAEFDRDPVYVTSNTVVSARFVFKSRDKAEKFSEKLKKCKTEADRYKVSSAEYKSEFEH